MLSGFWRREDAQRGNVHGGFRPDIEGLRAVAVLSVLFFHLQISAFRGGFAGVDMFFVISGYLITRNILADISAGRFTFRNFYARRIRRIFPAMLVTVAAVIVAGALWLPPPQLVDLGKSGFASLAFVANIYFWWGAQQYFAPDSSLLPLLHLWSLSVEEQFYIFWPLLMLAIVALRGPRLALVIGAIGAVSFAGGLYASRINPSIVFYLMPCRVYQFALGAFALVLERWVSPSRAIQYTAQGIGLLLCAAGVLILGSHSLLPGIAASLGATLIIFGGTRGASMPLLTNPISAYVGRISYSLYLVHWPVAVFANYIVGPRSFGMGGLAIQLAIILILSVLMHHFVEQPFLRRDKTTHTLRNVRLLILASLILATTSATAFLTGGWAWRLNAAQARINAQEAFGVAPCPRDETSCTFGAANGTQSVLLIGDSYAQHYVSALDAITRDTDMRGEEQIQQGCLVLSGLVRLGYPDDRCRAGRDRILAAAKQSTAPVIISEAWTGYRDGSIGDDGGHAIDVKSESRRLGVLRQALERTIAEISRPNRRVLIIGAPASAACDFTPARLGTGPLPHDRTPPCQPRSRADVQRATARVNGMLAQVQARHPESVSLILPETYMCEKDCPIVQDGVSLYEDAGHLTVAGSLRFGARARADIVRFLRNAAPSGTGQNQHP